jgi:hypothetical protein
MEAIVEGTHGSRLLVTKPRYHRRLDEPSDQVSFATWIYDVYASQSMTTVDWIEVPERRHVRTRQHPLGTDALEASVEHWRLVEQARHWVEEPEDSEGW